VASDLDRELAGLLVASRLWATGRPLDGKRLARARDTVLLANHRRYVAAVPRYAELALELGLSEVDDVETITDELLVGVSLFKSYDDGLLERGDYARLTAWVGEVSTLTPEPELGGVDSLGEWLARMRAAGVAVTMSSGTSGRPSFVPRDAATLAALRNNGRCYSMLAWGGYAESTADFDALLLTDPGGTHGLNAVADGVADVAGRTAFVPVDLDAPDIGLSVEPGALASAVELAGAARREGRLLLVFGAPPAVARLCRAALAAGRPIPVPDDAMLVTGGGWKSVSDDIDRAAFAQLVEEAMGLPPQRTVDVYGMSECNAYMLRCAQGRYHVPPVLDAVVVDSALRAMREPDATGLVAVLDPFAFSYPGFLLTGDWGRLVADGCACGLEGPGFVGEITRAPGYGAKGCAGVAPGALV
jgi:hypothetical protein